MLKKIAYISLIIVLFIIGDFLIDFDAHPRPYTPGNPLASVYDSIPEPKYPSDPREQQIFDLVKTLLEYAKRTDTSNDEFKDFVQRTVPSSIQADVFMRALKYHHIPFYDNTALLPRNALAKSGFNPEDFGTEKLKNSPRRAYTASTPVGLVIMPVIFGKDFLLIFIVENGEAKEIEGRLWPLHL